jgi:hypothetical protein
MERHETFMKYLEGVLNEITNAKNILKYEDECLTGSKYDLIVRQFWKWNYENNIINLLKEALNENGLVCFVVPVGMLFTIKDQRFREALANNFHIKGVITLKNSVFEQAGILMAILLLDLKETKTWLTSAANLDELTSLLKDENKYKRKKYYTANLKTKNFMPEYYNDEIEKLEMKLNKYETKTLGDIADIIVGRSILREELSDDEGIPYLRARNIVNNKIVSSDTFVSPDCIEKYSKQILMIGDIVLSKNFGERRLTQITEDDLPAVASNGLIIIRANKVPDEYLYKYFTSKTGKNIFMKQLSQIQTGTTISTINVHDFKEIKIPILDNKTMVELFNIEKLDKEETYELTQKLSVGITELEIEKMVISQFFDIGWDKNSIVINNSKYIIRLDNGSSWRPDIVLLDNEEMIAIVEVKGLMKFVTYTWIERMKEILNQTKTKILIITTGAFYDVYITATGKNVRYLVAPTKTQLLELLEKEVQE